MLQVKKLRYDRVHGNDETGLYAELQFAVEEMIDVISAGGRDLPCP